MAKTRGITGRMNLRLDAEELGLDFYGLRDRLVDLGVEWI